VRRTIVGVIITFALGCWCVPLTAGAQPPTTVYRIGWLSAGSPPSAPAWSQSHPLLQGVGFLEGLGALGYREGQNLVIEYRWAERRFEHLAVLAAELARLNVDVIVALGGAAAGAAKQATATIPVVMLAGDPVGQGLIASLARPGGNITGVSVANVALSQKRLQLLQEVLTAPARLAMMWCPSAGVNRQQLDETRGAAQALGVHLIPLEVRGVHDMPTLWETATHERAEGLIVLDCAIIPLDIAAQAATHRLPAIYAVRSYVTHGGLMSYDPNYPATLRRAASYVDKILKGAKPADLPVEWPTTFELVINLKTATALGMTIPPSLLLLADEVIQ